VNKFGSHLNTFYRMTLCLQMRDAQIAQTTAILSDRLFLHLHLEYYIEPAKIICIFRAHAPQVDSPDILFFSHQTSPRNSTQLPYKPER